MDGSATVTSPLPPPPPAEDVRTPLPLEWGVTVSGIVTMSSPAVRDTFRDGEEIVTTPPGDAEALAFAIRALVGDASYRARVALAGRERVARDYAPIPLARRFWSYCQEARAR